MTQKALQTLGAAFFLEYQDPEIEKRLFFDVWADRAGFAAGPRRALWREVKRLTFKKAAAKRALARVRQKSESSTLALPSIGRTPANQPHR